MLEQQFIYFPSPWVDHNWQLEVGLPLEDIAFQAEDGTPLFGWYLPAPEAKAILVWSHGNAGNIIDRLDNMKRLYAQGISCFIYDYRGYGKSEGIPTESGLYQDGLAAYDYLVKEKGVLPSQIIPFGRSLGSAVATKTALERPVAGLMLESPFTSVEEMAKRMFLGLPAHLLVNVRYDVIGMVEQLQVPLLVLHGDQDEIVPYAFGKKVFEAATSEKSFYTIVGADHNDTYLVGGPAYFNRLNQFVDEVVVI